MHMARVSRNVGTGSVSSDLHATITVVAVFFRAICGETDKDNHMYAWLLGVGSECII